MHYGFVRNLLALRFFLISFFLQSLNQMFLFHITGILCFEMVMYKDRFVNSNKSKKKNELVEN